MIRVLALIPARGGSKGVPRKNVRPLHGKPLVAYAAETALAARHVTRAVLSTDDEEIASVGRSCGLDVPFMRPASLAGDDTPMLPVVQHAVGELERQGDRFDAICLLQPTSPLRRPEDVDRCLDLLDRSGADAVMTVAPVPHEYNPHWVYFQREDGALALSTGEAAPITRRQALPQAFHRDGSVYVVRRDVLMEQHSMYGSRTLGVVLDPANRSNIDDPDDWARVEQRLSEVS